MLPDSSKPFRGMTNTGVPWTEKMETVDKTRAEDGMDRGDLDEQCCNEPVAPIHWMFFALGLVVGVLLGQLVPLLS